MRLYIQVTCPGVWLKSQLGDVRLVVCLFGQRACTANVRPIFPFKFDETFCFEKVFSRCQNFYDVFNSFKDELVYITLEQQNSTGISTVLATYSSNLFDFLFLERQTFLSQPNCLRDLLFCPTRRFPGIIGPRLKFSAQTSVQAVSGCCLGLLENNDAMNEEINGLHSCCHFSVALARNLVSCQMEDRPPFVIRRADSKLLSRIPSLHNEYGTRKVYCCKSPHRYSKCAACRMGNCVSGTCRTGSQRTTSVSPQRLSVSSQKRPSVSPQRKSSISPQRMDPVVHNREDSSSDDDIQESVGVSISVPWKKNENYLSTPSPSPPEILRGHTEIRSTSPRPASPNVEMRETTDRIIRSPLFNRPSYRKRFGNLPANVTDRTSRPYSSTMQDQDRLDQTEYDLRRDQPTLDERHYSVPEEPCKQCHCSYNVCQYQCNCPYCPTYWRFRLGAPSRYYWQSFHRGLGAIYDDIYHRSPYL